MNDVATTFLPTSVLLIAEAYSEFAVHQDFEGVYMPGKENWIERL